MSSKKKAGSTATAVKPRLAKHPKKSELASNLATPLHGEPISGPVADTNGTTGLASDGNGSHAGSTTVKAKTIKAKTEGNPLSISDDQIRTASTDFKIMDDFNRLKVLTGLEGGPMHVGAISQLLGQSQPAVSHHLALMRMSRFLVPSRDGKHNFYSLTEKGRAALSALRAFLAFED